MGLDNGIVQLPKKVKYLCVVRLCFLYRLFHIADESGSDTQPSVVRPSKRKLKHNPNVQSTDALLKKQKKGAVSSNESSSDDEQTALSYKSKRSAMPEGPQDQGATAVLVRFLKLAF